MSSCGDTSTASYGDISTRSYIRRGVRRAIISDLVYIGALLHIAAPVANLVLYVHVVEPASERVAAAGLTLVLFAVLRGPLTIGSYGIWAAVRWAKPCRGYKICCMGLRDNVDRCSCH